MRGIEVGPHYSRTIVKAQPLHYCIDGGVLTWGCAGAPALDCRDRGGLLLHGGGPTPGVACRLVELVASDSPQPALASRVLRCPPAGTSGDCAPTSRPRADWPHRGQAADINPRRPTQLQAIGRRTHAASARRATCWRGPSDVIAPPRGSSDLTGCASGLVPPLNWLPTFVCELRGGLKLFLPIVTWTFSSRDR